MATPIILTPPGIRSDADMDRIVSRANAWLASVLETSPESVTATWERVSDRTGRQHLILSLSLDGVAVKPSEVFRPSDLEAQEIAEFEFRQLLLSVLRERSHQIYRSLISDDPPAVAG